MDLNGPEWTEMEIVHSGPFRSIQVHLGPFDLWQGFIFS